MLPKKMMNTNALLLTFDGLSNGRLVFNLFSVADEKNGVALTQPTHYHILTFKLYV
jgi:hypothetical protein